MLCGIAAYAALALLLEDARHDTVLPVGRHAAGRSSLEGDLADQARSLPREVGVRSQL